MSTKLQTLHLKVSFNTPDHPIISIGPYFQHYEPKFREVQKPIWEHRESKWQNQNLHTDLFVSECCVCFLIFGGFYPFMVLNSSLPGERRKLGTIHYKWMDLRMFLEKSGEWQYEHESAAHLGGTSQQHTVGCVKGCTASSTSGPVTASKSHPGLCNQFGTFKKNLDFTTHACLLRLLSKSYYLGTELKIVWPFWIVKNSNKTGLFHTCTDQILGTSEA